MLRRKQADKKFGRVELLWLGGERGGNPRYIDEADMEVDAHTYAIKIDGKLVVGSVVQEQSSWSCYMEGRGKDGDYEDVEIVEFMARKLAAKIRDRLKEGWTPINDIMSPLTPCGDFHMPPNIAAPRFIKFMALRDKVAASPDSDKVWKEVEAALA